jgi:hypothetical protein
MWSLAWMIACAFSPPDLHSLCVTGVTLRGP